MHQDRAFLADRAAQQLERDLHVGPAVRVGQALEIGAQEGFGELRGPEAALHQNRRERVRYAQLRRQHARRVRVGLSRHNPAWWGGVHSFAYNNTPQASQPSIVAPRWIKALRCVGTAVKQLPHELPCSG